MDDIDVVDYDDDIDVDFVESHLGERPPPAGTTPLVAIADIEMAVNIVCNEENLINIEI